MSIFPDGFLTALTKTSPRAVYTLQIEGIPDAFSDASWTGDPEDDASLFFGSDQVASRAAPARILPWLKLGQDLHLDNQELSGSEIDYREGRADRGTLRISISDRDGRLRGLWATRRLDKTAYLTDELTRFDTSITVSRDMSGEWDDGQILYVGDETIGAVGATSDSFAIARGLFGSRPKPHRGSTGSGVGERVTPYPTGLKGRKATLWLSYDRPEYRVRLFAGPIKSPGWEDLGRTLVLQCEDGQSALKRPIFTRLGERLTLPRSPNAPAPVIIKALKPTMTDAPVDPQRIDRLSVQIGPITEEAIPPGEFITVATPSVFMKLTRISEGSRQETLPGGTVPYTCCKFWIDTTFRPGEVQYPPGAIPVTGPGSSQDDVDFAIANSQVGQPVKEVTTIPNENFVTGNFTGLDGGLVPSNMITWLLQILTSTGAFYEGGTGTCAYDTLPEDQGLAIPPDEIDIAGFEHDARLVGSAIMPSFVPYVVPVIEPIKDAREFLIANLLKPFGRFLLIGADGRITIKQVRDLGPDEKRNLPSVSMSDLVLVSQGPQRGSIEKFEGPTRDGDKRTVSVEWSFGPVYSGGAISMSQKKTFNISDADSLDYVDDQDTLTVDYQGNAVERDLADVLASRFSEAPERISGRFLLPLFTRSLGDMVLLDFPMLPNGNNPGIGLTNVIAEVSKRQFDPARHVLDLELSLSNLGLAETRYIAPSARVVSGGGTGGASTTLTVSTNDYTASPQTDCEFFGPGVWVRILSADLGEASDPVHCIAGSGADDTIIVTGTFGRTVGAGDIVEIARYEDSRVDERTQYAFAASALEQLNESEDPAVWAK